MKRKVLWLGLGFILALLLWGSWGSGSPVQGGAPPTPTRLVPSLRGGQVTRDIPERLRWLNRKLGVPLEELQRMSPQQIQDLMIANVDRMGGVIGRLVRGADGKEQWQIFRGKPAQPTPTPAPYPPPTHGGPRSQQSTWRIFLPLVMKPPLDPVAADIMARLDAAGAWLHNLYRYADSTGRGFMKEFLGLPLGIKNWSRPGDGSYPRLAGHYIWDKANVFGKVTYYAVYSDVDVSDYSFEEGYDWDYSEPYIWADVYYNNPSPGMTKYWITIADWKGENQKVDLYLGDLQIMSNVRDSIGWSYTVYTAAGYGQPAHRYTITHGTWLGRMWYHAINNPTRAAALAATTTHYNFAVDIYEPIFGWGRNEADDYQFSYAAYHLCDFALNGVGSSLEWGLNAHRYAYESRYCLNRDAYIALSRQDYLVTVLQAVHILNKYGNPDYAYPDPANPQYTTTPRQIARWVEANGWNGFGVKAYGKDPNFASGVRTAAFLVLETLLGHRYGDATSRTYAWNTMQVMRSIQWGWAPFNTYQGWTANYGTLSRPTHQGAAMASWTASGGAYMVPPITFLQELLDWLGMPKEYEGVIITNAESTITWWQALRVYLYYKYCVSYGSGQLPADAVCTW